MDTWVKNSAVHLVVSQSAKWNTQEPGPRLKPAGSEPLAGTSRDNLVGECADTPGKMKQGCARLALLLPTSTPSTPRPPISTWENGFETRATPPPPGRADGGFHNDYHHITWESVDEQEQYRRR